MRSLTRIALALVLTASFAAAQITVGAPDNTIGGGGTYTFFADGLVFDVLSPTVLNTVDCYPGGAGNVTINVMDSTGVVVATSTTAVTAAGLTTIPLGFALNPGTGYTIDATGSTVPNLFRNTSGGTYPYSVPGVLDITGPINALAGYYYFFYNWNIGGTPPAAYWQTNSANASFDVDGVMVGGPYAGTAARSTVLAGNNAMVNVGSALTGAPYELFISTQALAGTNAGTFGFNTPGGQAVNINIADPTGLWLNGGFAPNLLPFPGNYSLPVTLPTTALLSAQGMFIDPTSIDGVSLTQGCELEFVTTTVLATITGDDVAQNVPLIAPIIMAGQVFNSIDVSTNGFIKLGNNGAGSDLSENADDFVNGAAGGGTANPTIGVIWEDIDMGNRASQMVRVVQDASGYVQVEWIDADYFPAVSIGNIICRIDNNAGVATRVTLDYTAFTGTATEGLIGVTDGGVLGTPSIANPHDLVMGGAVNPFISPAAGPDSVFQNFDGTGTLATPIAAEVIDLAPLVLTFDELAPGTWFTY